MGTQLFLRAAAALSLVAAVAHGQTVRFENIQPAATDPAITGWLSSHSVAIATTVSPRNQLFLYLHGQGGTGTGANELLRTAAQEGFHAIGLTYANDWSPFITCAGDTSCFLNLRREIIDGTDRTPLISVSRANSVENRVIKLIQHLDTLHPEEDWSQFLDAGAIRWSRVVLWGHSQGGGNAGVIAKDHAVARACLSAPAADGGVGSPAPWWATHATPSTSYFGFCHTQDALSTKVAFWNALGMGAFGGVVDIASSQAPYSNTHELSTSVEPAIANQYHNSVVSDAVTPRNPDNTPVYKPVWRYMMSAGSAPPTNQPTWNDVAFATVPTSTGNVTLFMDIYAATSGTGPRPVLVWIHGGGWQSGSHNQAPAHALALRSRGITVASIGYRLSGQASFPAQAHDCKGAIRFLRANAAQFGIDPARIIAWGSSAGAHLATLITTSGNTPSLEGDTGGNIAFPSAVLAGLSYFGPTDILNMQPDCALQPVGCSFNHDDASSPESALLGINEPGQGIGWLRANAANPAPPFPQLMQLATAVNPISHVDPSDPPMFIAHGEVDTTVPLFQSVRLRDALLAASVPANYRSVPGAGHGALGDAVNNAAADWIVTRFFCGSADFDGDGDTGTDADIEAFFACIGGNCCASCGSADFDADGDTGADQDIEAFFRVLGGGSC